MKALLCLLLMALNLYADYGYDDSLYNLSKITGHDTGIVILTYNRPHYLSQVIAAFEKNPEAEHLPFVFVLDGGEHATQAENEALINQSTIKHKYIFKHTENYGCGRSIINARRLMFEHCNFERIIFFEDDLIVSPHYIGLTLRLHDWALRNYDNIGLVQCTNRCFLGRTIKSKKLQLVTETHEGFWGYCLSRKVYDAIKPFMDEHEEYHLKSGTPNYRKIAYWMQKKLTSYKKQTNFQRIFPSQIDYQEFFRAIVERYKKNIDGVRNGQDFEMRLALYLSGYVKLNTVVNRAKYVGRTGTHHNSRHWDTYGFSYVHLHDFESDATENQFIIGNMRGSNKLALTCFNQSDQVLMHILINSLVQNAAAFSLIEAFNDCACNKLITGSLYNNLLSIQDGVDDHIQILLVPISSNIHLKFLFSINHSINIIPVVTAPENNVFLSRYMQEKNMVFKKIIVFDKKIAKAIQKEFPKSEVVVWWKAFIKLVS